MKSPTFWPAMDDPLLAGESIAFSTRDYAQAAGLSMSAASHRLRRISKKGFAERLTRGLWVKTRHPQFTPYGCAPHLLGAAQGYVSFLSALHRHGLLSQIPERVQIATTGHGRRKRTPWAVYEFFQMHPRMILEGVDWVGTVFPYRMAGPEKALVDTLYLSTRKGRRFANLPLLDLEACRFRKGLFRCLVRRQIPEARIRLLVLARSRALGFL